MVSLGIFALNCAFVLVFGQETTENYNTLFSDYNETLSDYNLTDTDVDLTTTSIRRIGWNREEIPNPQTTNGSIACGRGGAPSWVCDPNHVLSDDEAASLDYLVYNWLRFPSLPCPCSQCNSSVFNYRMFIVIIDRVRINNFYLTNIAQRLVGIKEMANYLRDKTFYGEHNCNDTLVVVLATNDRSVSTSVGDVMYNDPAGLKCTQKIFQESSRILGDMYYADGLFYLIDEYIRALRKSRPCPAQEPWWLTLCSVSVSLAFFIVIGIDTLAALKYQVSVINSLFDNVGLECIGSVVRHGFNLFHFVKDSCLWLRQFCSCPERFMYAEAFHVREKRIDEEGNIISSDEEEEGIEEYAIKVTNIHHNSTDYEPVAVAEAPIPTKRLRRPKPLIKTHRYNIAYPATDIQRIFFKVNKKYQENRRGDNRFWLGQWCPNRAAYYGRGEYYRDKERENARAEEMKEIRFLRIKAGMQVAEEASIVYDEDTIPSVKLTRFEYHLNNFMTLQLFRRILYFEFALRDAFYSCYEVDDAQRILYQEEGNYFGLQKLKECEIKLKLEPKRHPLEPYFKGGFVRFIETLEPVYNIKFAESAMFERSERIRTQFMPLDIVRLKEQTLECFEQHRTIRTGGKLIFTNATAPTPGLLTSKDSLLFAKRARRKSLEFGRSLHKPTAAIRGEPDMDDASVTGSEEVCHIRNVSTIQSNFEHYDEYRVDNGRHHIEDGHRENVDETQNTDSDNVKSRTLVQFVTGITDGKERENAIKEVPSTLCAQQSPGQNYRYKRVVPVQPEIRLQDMSKSDFESHVCLDVDESESSLEDAMTDSQATVHSFRPTPSSEHLYMYARRRPPPSSSPSSSSSDSLVLDSDLHVQHVWENPSLSYDIEEEEEGSGHTSVSNDASNLSAKPSKHSSVFVQVFEHCPEAEEANGSFGENHSKTDHHFDEHSSVCSRSAHFVCVPLLDGKEDGYETHSYMSITRNVLQ